MIDRNYGHRTAMKKSLTLPLFIILPLLTKWNFCSMIGVRKLRLLPQKGMSPVLRSYVTSPSHSLLPTPAYAHHHAIPCINCSPGYSWHSVCSAFSGYFAGKEHAWHLIPDTLIALQVGLSSHKRKRGSIVASRRQRGETFDESRCLQRTV